MQACPHEAIAIRLVDVAEINAAASAGAQIVPGAFDSGYTKPTTKYFSKRGIPKNAEPADAHALRLEHPHWPLIIMLLFSQLAVGMFVTSAVDGDGEWIVVTVLWLWQRQSGLLRLTPGWVHRFFTWDGRSAPGGFSLACGHHG